MNRHRRTRRHSCPGGAFSSSSPTAACPWVRPDEESLRVPRRHLDASSVGILRDELVGRAHWSVIELKASGRWSLRLLEVLAGPHPRGGEKRVGCLVLDEPSEAACLFLAQWLQQAAANANSNSNTNHGGESWTALEHLVWNRATITRRVAVALRKALAEQAANGSGGSRLEKLTVLGGFFEGGTGAVRALADGLAFPHNGLRKLSVRSCHLEDAEIAVLVRALEGHPTLEELDVGTNFCQEAGILALASLLTSGAPHPSGGDGDDASDGTADEDDDQVNDDDDHRPAADPSLSPLLRSPSSSPPSSPLPLQSLPPPLLAPHGASRLRKLDLSCQDVWDDREYFIHLASALSHPSCAGSLRELDLSSNFLRDDHFVWVLLALRDNPRLRLERLDLAANRITDVGLSAAAKILPRLDHLRKLNLAHNRYTPRGVGALARGLRHNTSLVDLGLDHADDDPSDDTTLLWYYLALNRGGRCCKAARGLPPGLWPLLLARVPGRLSEPPAWGGIVTPADVRFDLLKGPALLERG